MARKQVNIRLDSLTIEAIKRIAQQYNMSESQVVTRAVILLEQKLEQDKQVIRPEISG
jgi:hypothetical protein